MTDIEVYEKLKQQANIRFPYRKTMNEKIYNFKEYNSMITNT